MTSVKNLNQRYALWFIFGLALIAMGIFILGVGDIPGSALVSAGVIIIILMSVRALRTGEGPEQDERTRRIGAWGLSYSWFATFVLLFILFWVDYLGIIHLGTQVLLLVLVLTMAISARLFQWYFFRQGDVE